MSMWFGTAQPGEDGNWLDQVFYFSLIVGPWWVVRSRGLKWNKLFAVNTAFFILFAYFALSVLWAYEPYGAFKRLFKEFGTVFAALVLLTEKDPLVAIRGVYLRCSYVLIPFSFIFIRWYPELGRVYSRGGAPEYTGVTTQKNSLGELVLVATLFFIWDYVADSHRKGVTKRMPWNHLFLFALGLVLLHISQSQTAFVCILAGSLLILKGNRLVSPSFNKAILVAVLCAPWFLLLTQQFSSFVAPLVEALGRDLTFTGRTEIWKQVLASDKINPLLGYGYYNFWGSEGGAAVRSSIEGSMVHSAHNGYLDIYIDGGLVGIGLLFGLLYLRGKKIASSLYNNRYQQVRFALLIAAIVYNLTESTFWRLQPMGFTALLVLLDLPARKPGNKERGLPLRPRVRTLDGLTYSRPSA